LWQYCRLFVLLIYCTIVHIPNKTATILHP